MSGAGWDMTHTSGHGGTWGALRAAPIVGLHHLRRRWWARPPFIPMFSARHLAWRRATAYGSAKHPVDREDLIAYLAWVGRFRRATR